MTQLTKMMLEKLQRPELLSGLKTIATATGGLSLVIRQASEMAGVFATISRDLAHGYLLAIRADSDPSGKWHNLDVVLTSPHGRRVRARQGYFGTP